MAEIPFITSFKKSFIILTALFFALFCCYSFAAQQRVNHRSTNHQTPANQNRYHTNNANHANDTNPTKDYKWHFLIAPYGWLFGMHGPLVVKGSVTNVDLTPSDTLRLISDIDAIWQLHLEALHGPLALMVDTTYLKLTTDVGVGPIGLTLTPSLTIIDFGAFYTIATNPAMGDATTPVRFQLFGGGRYFKIAARVTPKRFPTISGSQHILAPIVGARLIFPVEKQFQFIVRGDVGGFNVDCTRSTWSATILGQYLFHHWLALSVGYRALGVHFMKEASGGDLTLYGPVVGLIFKI